MGTDITQKPVTVIDRVLGVQLVVADAETHELAAYLAGLTTIRGQLADEEAIVQAELRERIDRTGVWTHQINDPDRPLRYRLRVPSPTAGTEDYARDLLRAELLALIAANVIDRSAARAALKRTVTVTMTVDPDADLDGLTQAMERTTGVGGARVYDLKLSTAEKVLLPGVNALKRIGGQVAEAVSRAKRDPKTPERHVSVDVETRTS